MVIKKSKSAAIVRRVEDRRKANRELRERQILAICAVLDKMTDTERKDVIAEIIGRYRWR